MKIRFTILIIEHSKPGVHIDYLSIDNVVDKESLKADLCKLADQALPPELNSVSVTFGACV